MKSKFKAELYIFLQKKLKDCLLRAVGDTQRDSLPSDIVIQFDQLREQAGNKAADSFQETQQSKIDRLAEEFDQLDDVSNAEEQIINCLVTNSATDAEKWYDYAKFCLRRN